MGVIKSKHRVASTYSCQNGEANHEKDAAKVKCADIATYPVHADKVG